MADPSGGWQHVELPEAGLAFGYPRSTPKGQAVELDDVRVHARSEDGEEAYFELSRHLEATALRRYEEERDFLVARYGAEVTGLTATTLDGLPAQEFTAAFGDTVRRFVLVECGRWLYRVVYDPRSTLNLAVLETIRISPTARTRR
jgi:hypothetical protein